MGTTTATEAASTTTSPVISRTRAALLILEHAERSGLPTPFSVRACSYAEPVDLQFSSLVELTEWSLWLEQPITSKTVVGAVHHTLLGTALDQPVECSFVELTPMQQGADQ